VKAPARESWATLIEAFRGAYERKDIGALSGFFADDVREHTAVGRGAVRQLYVASFQALDHIRYELSQVSARPGHRSGELLVHGRFRIRAVDARHGARPVDVSGPIRWTLRHEGEALRIVGIDYEAEAR
jgi:ketosteroid isomerase-like protein